MFLFVCTVHCYAETVKAVTLAFRSIHQLLIRDNPAKFEIPNSTQSPGIAQNSDSGIFDFQPRPHSNFKKITKTLIRFPL